MKNQSPNTIKLRAKIKLLLKQAHKAALEALTLQDRSAKLAAEAQRLQSQVMEMENAKPKTSP